MKYKLLRIIYTCTHHLFPYQISHHRLYDERPGVYPPHWTPVLQGCVLVAWPLQWLPPSLGAGLSQLLLELCTPPVQVLLHALHGCHDPQLPWTANNNNIWWFPNALIPKPCFLSVLYAIWNFHTPLFASHPAFPRISFQVLDESLLAFACRLVVFNRTLGVENLVGWANQFRHCRVCTRINALHPEYHTWKQYKSLFRSQELPFAGSC